MVRIVEIRILILRIHDVVSYAVFILAGDSWFILGNLKTKRTHRDVSSSYCTDEGDSGDVIARGLRMWKKDQEIYLFLSRLLFYYFRS